MKVTLIDNYDSFTYNLAHLLKELGAEVRVVRNDAFDLGELSDCDKLVLSPGPGVPSESGLLEAAVRRYAPAKPILGICLGEQAIGEVFGARLVNLERVFHGVQTPVRLLHPEGDYVFAGLGDEIPVGRYHSWVVSGEGFPACLEVTALSGEGQVMALRHRDFDVQGLQFHPESVLTPCGAKIVGNWLAH